jgi:hypothetical protein
MMRSVTGAGKVQEHFEAVLTWHQYLGQHMAAGVDVSRESSQGSTPHLLQNKQQEHIVGAQGYNNLSVKLAWRLTLVMIEPVPTWQAPSSAVLIQPPS